MVCWWEEGGGVGKRVGVSVQSMGETEKDFCQNVLQLFQKNIDRRNILLVLLAFSKALDRIRREEILHAASSKGLPIPFVRWLCDFLSHRTVRVQINGERGDSAPL